ncbi:radical SAM protein [bacterium]|nr:radical SAM protein [bacterium]
MRVVVQEHAGYFLNDILNPFSKIKWRDLGGKPYVWHVMEGLKRCKKIDEVILFTQDTPENKEVVNLAQEWNLNLRYCGIPWNWDVALEWFKSLNADVVIDGCFSPLIDPESLNSRIDYFIEKDLDFLRTEDFLLNIYKSGLWSKIYEVGKSDNQLLQQLIQGYWLNFVIERTDLFKSEIVGKSKDIELLGQDRLKWFCLLKKIYKRFYRSPEIVDLNEVVSLYEQEPEWFKFFPGSQLEIEVTNDCNLKCIMCPRTSKMSREIGYMDFELFKKIIDETEASSIHFSGLGEPLLHPQIREMFAYAKEKELEVGLRTNGLGLDEGFSKQIIEREFVDYIIFGLDAATKETYAKIKGVDLFDKAVENITKFLELKKEILKDEPKYYGIRKPLIGVQILKMKETDKEIEQFMNEWDIQEKVKKMINYRSRVQKSESVDAELWETIYSKFLPVEHAIIGHFNNFCGQIEDRSVIDVTPLKRFPCKQLQSGISILWNGDIVLCRQDFDSKSPIRNLRDQSLSEILESEKLKNIWQAHKDGEYDKLPLCKDCKEWYYNLYA